MLWEDVQTDIIVDWIIIMWSFISNDVVHKARPGLEEPRAYKLASRSLKDEVLSPWPWELHWQFFGVTLKLKQDNKLIIVV